jgi:hypothetical protein
MPGTARGFWMRRAGPYGSLVLTAYLLILAQAAWNGAWLTEGGQPQPADFLSFWSAGKMALADRAADAYDWALHKQAQVEAVGQDFERFFAWHNPPHYFFLVTPFAIMPYQLGWVLWAAATFLLFAASLRLVLPGFLVPALLAAPVTIWSILPGQNGFLTAALMVASLGLVERRPWMAGLFLGLLTYKPQFGLLFPLFLLAGSFWRTIVAAVVATAALSLASLTVFGLPTWEAFLASLGTSNDALMAGGAAWTKLQSAFALAYQASGSVRVALGVQVCTLLLVCSLLIRQWVRPASYDRRAAALLAAAYLATPYVYIYDGPILTAAAAFLVRDGLQRGFPPGELLLIATALMLPAPYPLLGTVSGLMSALMLFVVAIRAQARHGPGTRAVEEWRIASEDGRGRSRPPLEG